MFGHHLLPVSALRAGGVAPCSWTPQESQVEGCEHQDDSNIHCQPFPESVSEEHEIYTDYDGCHCHHVKHDNYLSDHFSPWFNRKEDSEILPVDLVTTSVPIVPQLAFQQFLAPAACCGRGRNAVWVWEGFR